MGMKNTEFAKLVILINSAVPLGMLGYDAVRGQLGVNPIESAVHITGMLALVFLFLSLAVTPLRLLTGKNWLSNFRRMLGLYAFFYGCVHFTTYFVFQRSLSFSGVVEDTVKRSFILLGMTALILMVPLAITSTAASVKRLGAVNWKRLHRLAYVSAICGAIHYYMSVKADVRIPISFIIVLAVLLGYRLIGKRFNFARAKPVRVTSPASQATSSVGR